ncbi:uncharacterized protein LOC135842594 isoform X2 [Planococcus citri]|uniref:uncharacterized protein LOC135842594 isoform X2 n=1 Tax=Planococcus citri TaxID=170843 RepID=UPI0031F7EB1A
MKNRSSSAWAGILDEFAQTSNAQVQFMNAIFYNPNNTRKQSADYLKQYFHAEAYEISLGVVNSNEAMFALFDEWRSKITIERARQRVDYFMKEESFLIASASSFTSCWDTPKACANSVKEMKFKTLKGEIDIEAFNAKETIGYYNNVEQKYEAIRLPYKKGEFAMIVVLPNQNQSLESFSKFTKNDHEQILQRVDENHENIDYVIPFMTGEWMSMNEKGTSINSDDEIICEWTSAQETREVNKIDYKPFHVNRPFAVYIYHERTKLVFMHALINNPPLGAQKFCKVLLRETPRNVTMAT